MKPHHEVQCDVYWQVLRVSTLPRYNSKGGWDTREGVLDNIARLQEYLKTPYSDVRARRLYRVRSLLLSTMREQRRTNSPHYQVVLAFYNALPPAGRVLPPSWRGLWGKAKKDLQELLAKDPDTFNNVKRELGAYLKNAQGDQEALGRLYEMMVEAVR